MNHAEYEMARRCYGYGSWEAPYWFIGPEPGQSASENNDLNLRNKGFRELEKDGLCDCAVFHGFIRETRWHRARKPALQPTWRSLILLLMTFLKKPVDEESLRTYQRDQWGRLGGETCVIELSGLPARNLNVPRERERFRHQRIKFIRKMIRTHKPIFVVMYGQGDMEHWQKISGIEVQPESVQKVESTIFAFARHPVAHGQRKKDWVRLGNKMRSTR